MKSPEKNLPVAAPSRHIIPSLEEVLVDTTPPPTASLPIVLTGLGVIGLFFAGIVVWSVFVPLSTTIHAPGELVFQGKRQSVQHLEGGIVSKILIKDGEQVKAGQPLIELEQKQIQPIVAMLEEQSAAEAAYVARLEAESRDLPGVKFSGSASSKAAQNESRLFAARRAAYEQQIQLFRLQISQIRESIKGIRERLESKKIEISTIREQLNANMSLQKEGYVSRTVILDLQRQLAALTGEKESIAASLASEQQRIHELEQRIVALRTERIQGAANELKMSNQRRLELQERIRPARDTLERNVIRAPVNGKVVGLKVTTVGGVITPRDTLMEIAPTEDQLIVEAKVRVEDINDVKVGKDADVTISGMERRTLPPLKAKVTYVSDDRIVPPPAQGLQPYYLTSLALDREFMKQFPDIRLMSGMTAMVAINGKPRKAFSYFVDPLLTRVRKAVYAK